jgi:AmiR/NasT family two-component response regulator
MGDPYGGKPYVHLHGSVRDTEPSRTEGSPRARFRLRRVTPPQPLRILIASEQADRIARVATSVDGLGHFVTEGWTSAAQIDALGANERPDVALVVLGSSAAFALELILQFRDAECPVVAVLERHDTAFICEAARCGVFAYVADGSAENLQSALDITLSGFGRYHGLQGAFERRAVTERAKGILMERYQVAERRAFELLRDHSRQHALKLVDVAQAVVDGNVLASEERTGERSDAEQADSELPGSPG